MAAVKTFRVHPTFGVPDKEIKEWLDKLEKKATVQVVTTYIPSSMEKVDDRLCVIVTNLDAPLG